MGSYVGKGLSSVKWSLTEGKLVPEGGTITLLYYGVIISDHGKPVLAGESTVSQKCFHNHSVR